MTVALKDLLAIAALLVAIIGGVGIAVTYFASRFRRESDKLREEYITNLERDRRELQTENRDQRSKIGHLEGQVDILRQMVMGRCRSFAEDPATHGCTHCGLGLAYGQRTRADNGHE